MMRFRVLVLAAGLAAGSQTPTRVPLLGTVKPIGAVRAAVGRLRTAATTAASRPAVQGPVAAVCTFAGFPTFSRPLQRFVIVGTPTADVWGVFCPVVGILFATLISATVERLWSRQEALRAALTAEATELLLLVTLIDEADQADAADAEVPARPPRRSQRVAHAGSHCRRASTTLTTPMTTTAR